MAAPELQAPVPPTDEDLIERIRFGDEVAFGEVYERYFRRVYHFLDKRLRNRADTEEITQEVFFNIFSSLHTFRGEAPFAAWVFGLTRRTLANRFKKKRHAMVPLQDDEGEHYESVNTAAGRDPEPHEAYVFRERVERLERVVRDRLNPEQRRLFQLHHIENQSIEDIARTLRKSEDAVKSHLYRARKLLLAR